MEMAVGKDRKKLIINTYRADKFLTTISPDLLKEEIESFKASKGKAKQLKVSVGNKKSIEIKTTP
jgi:hypothetical protein